MTGSSRSVWSLAWRESRTARRRLLLYMSSISLGVAALVAIDSFSANIVQSVKDQSRAIMGGDISFNSRRPFPPAVDSLFDSLSRHGISFARVTTFPSMAVVPRTTGRDSSGEGRHRELSVTARSLRSRGRWAMLHQGANAIVEPGLLTSLNAKVGDTLRLNFGTFTIIASIKDIPGAVGIGEMLGPRVFIPARYIAETQLLVFGSIAERTALAKLPPREDPDKFIKPFKTRLNQEQVRSRTVTQSEMATAAAIESLRASSESSGRRGSCWRNRRRQRSSRIRRAQNRQRWRCYAVWGASSGQVLTIYVTAGGGNGTRWSGGGRRARSRYPVPPPRRADAVASRRRPGHSGAERGAHRTGRRGMDRAHFRAASAARASERLAATDAASRYRCGGAAHALERSAADLVNVALILSVVLIALMRAQTAQQGVWISGATGLRFSRWRPAPRFSVGSTERTAHKMAYVVRRVPNLYVRAIRRRAVTLCPGIRRISHQHPLSRADTAAAVHQRLGRGAR